MEALRVRKQIEKDGEVTVTGLPCKQGQKIELILLLEPGPAPERPFPTARDLLESGLTGIWKDRTDIGSSTVYARKLRREALRAGG